MTDLSDLETYLLMVQSEVTTNGKKMDKLEKSVRTAAILQEAGRLAGRDPISPEHLKQADQALKAARNFVK